MQVGTLALQTTPSLLDIVAAVGLVEVSEEPETGAGAELECESETDEVAGLRLKADPALCRRNGRCRCPIFCCRLPAMETARAATRMKYPLAMKLDAKAAARLLRRISSLMEVRGDDSFRVRAMANAARAIERLQGDVGELASTGALLEIRGVGKGTVAVLSEAARGETPDALASLESEIPAGVRDLLELRGLGPKKVRALWKDLRIMSPGELEYACLENRLVDLKGFGPKSQASVLDAVRFFLRNRASMLVHEASAAADELVRELAQLPGVDEVSTAGELCRGTEVVSRIELLAAAAGLADVAGRAAGKLDAEVEGSGVVVGRWHESVSWRLTVVPPDQLEMARFERMGPQAHVKAVLGEVGVAPKSSWYAEPAFVGLSEDALYDRAGLQPIAPVLRDDPDILARARRRELPELAGLDTLQGALHNHTRDSDGADTLEAMAQRAMELGWSWLGIADHSPAAFYAHGVDGKRLRDQWRRIDEFNRAGAPIRVFKGLEADILTDGSLDIPEGCAGELEYVVASVHSAFSLQRDRQTERLLRAVEHPACRVLGHVSGRLLLARRGYDADYDAVIDACAVHGVALEINASPHRLDAGVDLARRALARGVKLIVNPDAHSVTGLADVKWGWSVAQAAGAEAGDLLNARTADELLQWFRRPRNSR